MQVLQGCRSPIPCEMDPYTIDDEEKARNDDPTIALQISLGMAKAENKLLASTKIQEASPKLQAS